MSEANTRAYARGISEFIIHVCGSVFERTSAIRSQSALQGPASSVPSHTLIRNTSHEVWGGRALSHFCPVHQRQRSVTADQATATRLRGLIPSSCFQFHLEPSACDRPE